MTRVSTAHLAKSLIGDLLDEALALADAAQEFAAAALIAQALHVLDPNRTIAFPSVEGQQH
jgi:hypothetical protein